MFCRFSPGCSRLKIIFSLFTVSARNNLRRSLFHNDYTKTTVSFYDDETNIKLMLVQVRQRFYNHEDFMLELQSHQGAVRKVFNF